MIFYYLENTHVGGGEFIITLYAIFDDLKEHVSLRNCKVRLVYQYQKLKSCIKFSNIILLIVNTNMCGYKNEQRTQNKFASANALINQGITV